MNGDLILIFSFALAALWIIFRSPRERRRRRREQEQESAARQEVDAELLEQLSRLEERIKVLERIVTDDPKDLRRQFRDLGG